MGISRDSIHKRRLTGGKRKIHRKKRKYELGRPPANTRLGPKLVRPLRVRGGHFKFRALRLEMGNYSWASECVTRKTRILGVVYNASNNELVRTNTLVKGSIVHIDATPFRTWYYQHYGIDLGKKAVSSADGTDGTTTEAKRSASVLAKLAARQAKRSLEKALEDQFNSGRLLACIASRPGQCGRADGYILEGKELEFYLKKLERRKKTK
jgi:small subunit ribosomal protein S8e